MARPTRRSLSASEYTAISSMPLHYAIEGGFSIDDFIVDTTVGTVTCPKGITVSITRTNKAVFGAKCRGCHLRQRCTSRAVAN